MKRTVSSFIVTVAFCGMASAQGNIINSLQSSVPGQGKVTVHQDAQITAMIIGEPFSTTSNSSSEKRELRKQGYRVQVYAGNNTRQSKNEAQSIANKIKEKFPDLDVYATFTPPRWLCRVGNYHTIEEADAAMRQLRSVGGFKEASIVKDQITVDF